MVGRGRNVAAAAGPVDVNVLTSLVLVVGKLGLDMEGVGTKVITLSLEEVGRQVLGAVAVEPRQSSGEGGRRDTHQGSLGDNITPAGLGLVDGLVEEVVKQQVLQFRVIAVGGGNVLEEDGANDAATTPHKGNGRLVEFPAKLLGGLLHQHEALGVRDDLGGVQGLLKVVEELVLVALKLAAVAADKLKLGRSLPALILEGRQAAGENGLGNQSHWLAEIESVDGSPLAGALLASLVKNLLDEGRTVVIVVVHDVAGDFNEERVQDALVPLGEDITNLLVGEAETALHDIVGLQHS